MKKFTVKRIDPSDKKATLQLHLLHSICFSNDDAPDIKKTEITGGWWWLVYDGDRPVAFCGMLPALNHKGYGYLSRSGVRPSHRGHGIQKRMIRVRERFAKTQGMKGCVTDATNDNTHSVNNLIAEGYLAFVPKVRWGLAHSVYLRKQFQQA